MSLVSGKKIIKVLWKYWKLGSYRGSSSQPIWIYLCQTNVEWHMNKGKYVFSQLLDFLDRNDFNYLARKYGGDKYVKQFTCYNQLCVLMFGQLSNRESLRDVILATQAHASKAYHLGFGKHAAKSTLADANTKRDYHAELLTSSSWMETSMPLILRQLTYVWVPLNGLCSERGKEESRYTLCMILRRKYPPFFT